MRSGRVEPELAALRAAAERLAERRREKVGSLHLLAAVAAGGTTTADLLGERRLGPEEVLALGSDTPDEVADPLRAALARAHDIAVRMGLTQAGAAHLLVALLNEPRCAARRAIEKTGTDLARLRAAAMQVGLGLVRERRVAGRPPTPPPAEPIEPPRVEPRKRPTNAVAVSLIPERSNLDKTSGLGVFGAGAPKTNRTAAPTTNRTEFGAPTPNARGPEGPAKTPDALSAERFVLERERFPTLCTLGKNLTLAAARGELDPVVMRDVVIEQTLDVLAKREGNNPCLVGAAGVGKTSIVRGLAQRIAAAEDVGGLDDRIIVEIPVGELIAGTGVRGALAARMAAIRAEVLSSAGRVVVFFDEIHQLFSGEAAEELGAELKLALARGELPCIGTSTLEEHRRTIGADAALARRFTLVEVEEPSREEAYLVLEALRPRLAAHHGVGYDDEALALSVAWSVRYLPGRALPDKAVSILDLGGARARRRGKATVGVETVAEVVADLADMPVERLLESDSDRLLRLEEILAERIVGHGPAIRRMARILRRNAAGLGSRRPIGTFLLLGPTGVGKTETAKAIAEVLFHCDSALTRIDLAEYGEAHAVARLIGSPPGYIGHEAGGQLTEAVRRRPYQVILLDELEKAHSDVLTAFLGVFDEGRLTDGRGRTVDFTNTVILMTSNLGAREVASAKRRVGFGDQPDGASDLEERLTAAARAALAPELYNRIDEVLVFSPLSRAEVHEIARRLLGSVARTLEMQRGIRLELGPGVVEHLLERGGFEPALGARPMKRAIARLVEGPLAERILSGGVGRGDTLLLELQGGELDFDVVDAPSDTDVGSAAE